MPHHHQKKIAVINDFCGFGHCSLAVSLPMISAMGIQCCPLPTAIFSNHTAFESCYHTDLTSHLDAYIDEWKKLGLEFNGILSGYLGSPEQIDIVERFFREFKRDDNIVILDPVMGDNGKIYRAYSGGLVKRMSALLPYADIITPNLTEACVLAGSEYREDMDEASLAALCEKLSEMGPKKIVISGIGRGEELENFVFEAGKPAETVRVRKIGPSRSGTGDVFSAIIAADAVKGIGFADSVRHAASFITKVLRRTVELDMPATDGICFEEFLTEI